MSCGKLKRRISLKSTFGSASKSVNHVCFFSLNHLLNPFHGISHVNISNLHRVTPFHAIFLKRCFLKKPWGTSFGPKATAQVPVGQKAGAELVGAEGFHGFSVVFL